MTYIENRNFQAIRQWKYKKFSLTVVTKEIKIMLIWKRKLKYKRYFDIYGLAIFFN